MRNNKKKGFTLVELLVTISIIAVLTTVSVVGYVTFIDKTNDSKAVTELTQIRDWAISYDVTSGNRNGILDDIEVLASIENAQADTQVTWGYDTESEERVLRYSVGKRYAYWILSTGKITNDCEFQEGDAPVVPTHECTSKCATCGKCTNEDCTETVCAEKCEGHILEHEHACEWKTVKNPTCIETGEKQNKCTLDGCSYVDATEEIPSLGGHDEVSHDAQAPTCMGIGWDAYVTCSRCNYTTKVEKSALGHTWSWVTDKEPTYTETGLKHEECTVCHAKRNENTVIPVKDHEHAHSGSVTKEATCTEKGVKTYTCSICNDTYTEDIPIIDHNYSAVVTAPTCDAAGYTTHTCSVCNNSYTDNEVAALGHTWSWVIDKEATYTETGLKHEECSVCDATRNANTEIPKITCDHNYTSVVTTEATCTTTGVKTFTCSKCNDTYTEGIASLGHDEEEHAAKDPTCTAIGWDAYVTCSRCDYTTYREKAALNHSYNSVVTPATCTKGGYTTYTCSRCEDSYKGNETDALGHIWTNACDASCDRNCGYTRTPSAHVYDNTCDTSCNVCGATRTITHKYDNACDASCNVCGATRTPSAHVYDNTCDTTCNVCGATRTITHTYDNACDASCNVCGATRTPSAHVYDNACDTSCNVCGATRTITHSYAAATCTAPKTCSVCGATEGNALGHSYTYTYDATNHTATCGRNGCSETVTEEHNYINGACVCGSTKITLSTASATAQAGGTSSKIVWEWSDGTTFTHTSSNTSKSPVDSSCDSITVIRYQTFKISSEGMTKVVITCETSNDATLLKGEGAKPSGVSVSNSGTTVTYTVTSGTVDYIEVNIGNVLGQIDILGTANVVIKSIEIYH